MRTRITGLAVFAALVIAMVLPTVANAASEWGSTSRWPWSGYWWPMLSSDLNLYDNGQAMQQYDTYLLNTTGRAGGAQAWERANHSTDVAANDWWGHCHAWASASILTPEPQASRTVGGVTFGTNQLRGLVTELYYQPTFNWLAGTRSNTDNTSDAAYKDIAPAWMDWLLRYYVRYYRYPFIMDISADSQVWNFPVFAYTRNSTVYAGGSESVSTTVWYSNPLANVTGTKYFSRTYTYNLVPGQLGTWTGSSVNDHPDFAWVPTGRKAMPHIDAGTVQTIEGQAV